MPNYIATYRVQNREIAVDTQGTTPLSALMGVQAYLQVQKPNGQRFLIDLAKYMLYHRQLDFTLTLQQLAATLTDLDLAGYGSTDVPVLDPTSQSFPHRLVVYDALAAPDITVSWTSIARPDIRNDIYLRNELNDLVLSSTTRNFGNCLVAVNGVFHKTYYLNGELYVEGGFFNIKNTRRMLISVYDTTTLGGHSIVPIGTHNIDASNDAPFDGVTLTFPNTDFTGSTLLLVMDGSLYALDGTYRLINRNRLVLDICKMDLINNFIHNPNTLRRYDAVKAAVEADLLAIQAPQPPSIFDHITYYLTEQYPVQKTPPETINLVSFGWNNKPTVSDAITAYLTNYYPAVVGNNTQDVEFVDFAWASVDLSAPSTTDMIYDFLAQYPYQLPDGAKAMLVDYEWTTKYKDFNSIINTRPMADFTAPSFVYNTLLSPHTFFVVIHNPLVYQRRYPLLQTDQAALYDGFGHDTPRGILLYNKTEAFPYVMLTEGENNRHHLSLGYSKTATDAYKTALNPQAIASPVYDRHETDRPRTATLLELFAPV